MRSGFSAFFAVFIQWKSSIPLSLFLKGLVVFIIGSDVIKIATDAAF